MIVFSVLISSEDHVDDGIDVGNVHFTVIVHIGVNRFTVRAAVATTASVDDDDHHIVCIGDVDLAIAIHILKNRNCRVADDLEK